MVVFISVVFVRAVVSESISSDALVVTFKEISVVFFKIFELDIVSVISSFETVVFENTSKSVAALIVSVVVVDEWALLDVVIFVAELNLEVKLIVVLSVVVADVLVFIVVHVVVEVLVGVIVD